MTLKILALGFQSYFKGSLSNKFDFIIVITGAIDIIMTSILTQGPYSNNKDMAISAFRGLRLLRIFKLAQHWKNFELLLSTLAKTMIDIASFSILLFLFIFIFTLLGRELFAERSKFDLSLNIIDLKNGKSRGFNFDTFQNSFVTVFITLTDDNIGSFFYNEYRAVGAASTTIFFVLMIIIGQKIIMNLFVAILLSNFAESSLKQKMYQHNRHIDNSGESKSWWAKIWIKIDNRCKRRNNASSENPIQNFKRNFTQRIQEEILMKQIKLEGDSLNLVTIDNSIRKALYKILTHPSYDYLIISIILISAIGMAMDTPLNIPSSNLEKTLFWIDFSNTIVFFFEAISKIIAFGLLFNGRWSYLRQSWNILDFVILMFSVCSLTPALDNLRGIKIFRILRILRLISRKEGLQVAVKALFMALPNIANITIMMLFFFLIFGIIAVDKFKGKLYTCSNAMISLSMEINSKWDCLNIGGEWMNRVYNFDNSVNALITLFVFATTVGWSDLMRQTACATYIDYLPGDVPSSFWIFFFIVFMIVGSFFFLNLFIAEVINTFNTKHDKIGNNDLITEKQKEWIDLRLLVLRSAPIRKLKEPQNKLRKIFFIVQSSKLFEKFILACILGNCFVLLLQWYEQPDVISRAGEILNYIFTGIFILEAIIKITAIEPREYFNDGWNRFDTVIVVGSLASIFISANTSLNIRGTITILRSFRVLRLLRLIKRGNSLQLIFNTFVITLKSLSNIGGLLIIFIFMYSLLGMILFGQIKRNGSMNDYINFENFPNSFITLFIVGSGDSWSNIMASFAFENSPQTKCINNPTYDQFINIGQNQTVGCGNPVIAFLFFLSYQFVINLIFLKIFIAVILQGYNDTQIQDKRLFNNDKKDHFRDIWKEFDPQATSFILLHLLRNFLFALGEQLGFDKSYIEDRYLQDQFIASLELPTYNNFSEYQFLDVLDALSFRLMVIDHIKNHKVNLERQGSNVNQEDNEKFIKQEIQKEVNKLIFQQKSDSIAALKEISMQQTKRVQQNNNNKDSYGLTSSHHMAAEATIRKLRQFVINTRFRTQNIQQSIDLPEIKVLSSLIDGNIHQVETLSIQKIAKITVDQQQIHSRHHNHGKLFVLGTKNTMSRGLIEIRQIFINFTIITSQCYRVQNSNYSKPKIQKEEVKQMRKLSQEEGNSQNILMKKLILRSSPKQKSSSHQVFKINLLHLRQHKEESEPQDNVFEVNPMFGSSLKLSYEDILSS